MTLKSKFIYLYYIIRYKQVKVKNKKCGDCVFKKDNECSQLDNNFITCTAYEIYKKRFI